MVLWPIWTVAYMSYGAWYSSDQLGNIPRALLKGMFPQTTMWNGWVESNFTNPTVKVWADLDNPFTDLPTSTFLSYFVRFLKGNTAVRFFLQKYVFFNFDFEYTDMKHIEHSHKKNRNSNFVDLQFDIL